MTAALKLGPISSQSSIILWIENIFFLISCLSAPASCISVIIGQNSIADREQNQDGRRNNGTTSNSNMNSMVQMKIEYPAAMEGEAEIVGWQSNHIEMQ